MTLQLLLLFSLFVFSAGLYAVLARRNLIAILIGLELMLNAGSLNFLAFHRYSPADATTGPIVVLFIIGLAAAEAAIALSIVVAVYRERHSIGVDELKDLKG